MNLCDHGVKWDECVYDKCTERGAMDAIERVKDLHAPICDLDGFFWCGECKQVPDHYGNVHAAKWPCNTLKAVIG